MKKYFHLLIFTAVFLSITVGIMSTAESGAYPQKGFDTVWDGSWPDVKCELRADNERFSGGDKIVLTLSLEVPGEFDAAQCVPVYDVNAFDAEAEGGVLKGGFTLGDAAVLSQKYEEKSPAGDPVNAYNCVVSYKEPVKDFKGDFFTFTLVAKDVSAAPDSTEIPVYVFVKLISETGENVVFEAKPSLDLAKEPPESTKAPAGDAGGGCKGALSNGIFWLETAIFACFCAGCGRGKSRENK